MLKAKKKKVRTTVLSELEDMVWVRAFEDAKNDGLSDLKADAYAYKAVCKRFPRLKKFDKFASQPAWRARENGGENGKKRNAV